MYKIPQLKLLFTHLTFQTIHQNMLLTMIFKPLTMFLGSINNHQICFSGAVAVFIACSVLRQWLDGDESETGVVVAATDFPWVW
jgi:hypothetical protein